MTDEELITALRMRAESELCRAAADRIEALVNEWSKDGEEILSLREKVEKLRGKIRDWEARIDACEWSTNSSLTEDIRAEMRATLTTEEPK